jgi:hypothetical protein
VTPKYCRIALGRTQGHLFFIPKKKGRTFQTINKRELKHRVGNFGRAVAGLSVMLGRNVRESLRNLVGCQ